MQHPASNKCNPYQLKKRKIFKIPTEIFLSLLRHKYTSKEARNINTSPVFTVTTCGVKSPPAVLANSSPSPDQLIGVR